MEWREESKVRAEVKILESNRHLRRERSKHGRPREESPQRSTQLEDSGFSANAGISAFGEGRRRKIKFLMSPSAAVYMTQSMKHGDRSRVGQIGRLTNSTADSLLRLRVNLG